LLLPPRSALGAVPFPLSRKLRHDPHVRLLSSTTCCPWLRTEGQVSGAGFSAIHFLGCSIRQVSCYTLLSGLQLPCPPSCCLNRTTPFMVSICAYSLAPYLVAWFIPLRHFCLPKLAHLGRGIRSAPPCGRRPTLSHLKFENRATAFTPPTL